MSDRPCPYCGEPLKPDAEALKVRGVSLGRFACLRCPKCEEFFYPIDSRNERNESAEDAAKRAGVWGASNASVDLAVSTVDKPGRARVNTGGASVDIVEEK